MSQIGRKRRYLQVAALILMLALVSQVVRQAGNAANQQSGSEPQRSAGNLSSDAPRIAAINGSAAGSNSTGASAAPAPPFEVGRSVKNDVSPPLRDIRAF